MVFIHEESKFDQMCTYIRRYLKHIEYGNCPKCKQHPIFSPFNEHCGYARHILSLCEKTEEINKLPSIFWLGEPEPFNFNIERWYVRFWRKVSGR